MELAAAFDRLTRRAVALELPVLAAHDLTMWEYVVLSGLVDGPAQTQARLADAVGRDKTRLIPILDALEARGLLRDYHLLPAARAALLARLGRQAEAIDAYRAALRLVQNAAERRFLERRLADTIADL